MNEINDPFVLIDCPEHLAHKVKLYCQGAKYEGIWECDETNEGISDSCPHFDVGIKTIEVDTMRDGEHDTYDARVYYCNLCGCAVEGDPDADKSLDCD